MSPITTTKHAHSHLHRYFFYNMCRFLRLMFACRHERNTEAIAFCKTPRKCLKQELFDQGAEIIEDIDLNDIPDEMVVSMELKGVYCAKCIKSKTKRLVQQENNLLELQKNLGKMYEDVALLEKSSGSTESKDRKSDFAFPNGELSILDVLASDSNVTPKKPARYTLHKMLGRMVHDSTENISKTEKIATGAGQLLKQLPKSQTCRHRRPKPRNYSICSSGSCSNQAHAINGKMGEFCEQHTCSAKGWQCFHDVREPSQVEKKAEMFCLAHTCSDPGCNEKVIEREWRFCGLHHWMEGDLKALRERLGRRGGRY